MSPDNSSVEELVARSSIQDFGGFCIVTIPGFETLTESERMKACAEFERRQITSLQDDGALLSRLQNLTPPPDPGVGAEEVRSVEGQARKDLEREGCPPCYPTDLEFPLQNIPEKYQDIISYWKFSGTGDVVLGAQLSDRERFRGFQRRIRRYYQHRNFSFFEEKVRERRRRHELEGDVRIRSDPGQQNRLENWIEFQNYHLQIHEKVEKERDDLEKELDVRTDAEDLAAIKELLNYAERRLGQHRNMLQWVERERSMMENVRPPSVKGDHDDQDGALKAVRRSTAPNRWKRRPKAHVVLGDEVRVSKTEPRKGNEQRRKRNTSKATPAIQNSCPLQSSILPDQDSRESKPRSTKEETALHQMRPQRLFKVKRRADASEKSPPATPLRRVARPKHRQSPQQPQPAVVKSRSGRVSRKPERWVPDPW